MAKKTSKYIIDKPKFDLMKRTNKEHGHLFWGALHFAQYEMTDKQLKTSTIKYAKAASLDHKLLSVLSDAELAFAGKYATVIVNGGELPENIEVSFKNKMAELLAKAEDVRAIRKAEAAEKAKAAKNSGPVLTVQDRMRIQAENVCAEFDTWIDDLMLGKIKTIPKEFDPAGRMKAAEFKAGQARYVRSFYEPELEEIIAVVKGEDEQVKEGYSNLKKSSALRVQKLLESIITSADMLATVAIAKRKTRKKKAPSTTKLISKLQYCESHPETGVASVSPDSIIGAQEVWVYNTKYRKLGKYVAQDAAGLTVKGTTIQDFSENESRCKNLRKPKEQLKEFMGCGKVKLRKFLDNIKAVDAKLNGRMNNNVVILKIFK